ncbi:MAG: IPTL-CTERM sorting domain-containing protein, partial [Burkholderiales bacterium]
ADENPYNFVIQGTGNAPAGTAAAIPTLSPWGLGLLSLLLGFGAAIRARRRR